MQEDKEQEAIQHFIDGVIKEIMRHIVSHTTMLRIASKIASEIEGEIVSRVSQKACGEVLPHVEEMASKVANAVESLHFRVQVPNPAWFSELSIRTRNILKTMGIDSVEKLAGISIQDFIDQRNAGNTSVTEIVAFLDKHGIHYDR